MESIHAINAFAALAHETRLALFRELIGTGAEGLAAGVIAERLGVSFSTLSHHLTILKHAGIITARRSSRHIFYAVEVELVRDLLGYLIDDCCRGIPALCGFTRATTGEVCHVD